MTLETSLTKLLFLPRFLQAQKDESRRDIHWVGQKKEVETPQKPGKRGDFSPKPDNTRGYRALSSIKLGDVDEAQKFFASQLVLSPYSAWIGTNHFCNLTLNRKRDGRPPMIFGRVKACYPTDGNINNIQDIELYFPHKNGQPDPITLGVEDILPPPQGVVQSYGIRVKFLASPEDMVDFQPFENLFTEKGFIIEFINDYIDLLHLKELDKNLYPWLYVVGSRWFASIPNSVQDEIRKSLKSLIGWNKFIFNYHPKWLPEKIRALNQELDFNYGFSEHFLIAPEDAQQTSHIVSTFFDKIFMQPMK